MARISARTLRRRMHSGQIKLSPIDRGREMLFRRGDVLRALGMTDGQLSPDPIDTQDHDAIDPLKFWAAMGRSKPTKQPA